MVLQIGGALVLQSIGRISPNLDDIHDVRSPLPANVPH